MHFTASKYESLETIPEQVLTLSGEPVPISKHFFITFKNLKPSFTFIVPDSSASFVLVRVVHVNITPASLISSFPSPSDWTNQMKGKAV